MKKQTLTLFAAAAVIYHLAVLAKDAEQWATNARRARANPTPRNVAGLLVSSGILLRTIRSL